MLAYVRERDRIIKLVDLLIEKEKLIDTDLSAVLYNDVEQRCWELLKSQIYPSPGFLLMDCDDVTIIDEISGDVLRQNSLNMLSSHFCHEILLILFLSYE